MALNLNHLRLVHGNDPRFRVQCGIDGCSYTGKSFSAFYSHIYRRHRDSGAIQRRIFHGLQISTSSAPAVAESHCGAQLQGGDIEAGKYFCVKFFLT